jgi:hypothetical protein
MVELGFSGAVERAYPGIDSLGGSPVDDAIKVNMELCSPGRQLYA